MTGAEVADADAVGDAVLGLKDTSFNAAVRWINGCGVVCTLHAVGCAGRAVADAGPASELAASACCGAMVMTLLAETVLDLIGGWAFAALLSGEAQCVATCCTASPFLSAIRLSFWAPCLLFCHCKCSNSTKMRKVAANNRP